MLSGHKQVVTYVGARPLSISLPELGKHSFSQQTFIQVLVLCRLLEISGQQNQRSDLQAYSWVPGSLPCGYFFLMLALQGSLVNIGAALFSDKEMPNVSGELR